MAWWRQVRWSVRSLAKQPGFTVVVVLVLGLGMGAATAVVDLTNLLAWRQVPAPRSAELVKVYGASTRGFVTPFGRIAFPDYEDYRDASQSFTGLAAELDREFRLTHDASTEMAWAAVVSGNYFDTLELKPTLGRSLNPDDDRLGAAPVLMVAHHLWQRWGGDPSILGASVEVEGTAFTVVGVGPAGWNNLSAGTVTDFFVPLHSLALLGQGALLEGRHRTELELVGRLQPGVTRGVAQAELATLAQRLDAEHPAEVASDVAAGRRITVTAATITHPVDLARMSPSLKLFAAAVVLLLLITCANVVHLMLARALGRQREMAVRLSVGASRGSLVRQLLTESLLLAFGGGLVGLVLAFWARAFLVAFASAEFAGEMRFDLRVLGVSFLVGLGVTLVFGLVPALSASRPSLTTALKDGASHGGSRRSGVGPWLAGAQVGLSVVLLIAGALLTESLRQRLQADLGFDDARLVIASISLPEQHYDVEEGRAFFRRLVDRSAGLPGVEAAGLSMLVPPTLFDIQLPFRLPEDPETERRSRVNVVDAGYFDALGITLERGRWFDAADGQSEAGVMVINQRLAETLWPGEDPLGRTLLVDSNRPDYPGPEQRVIGVVSNVQQHRSGDGVEPVYYLSADQRYRSRRHVVLRSTADPGATFDALRGLLQSLDSSLALQFPRTGPENRRQAFTFESMQAVAVGVFAALGFLLAVVGIFGVLSYAVSRRVREIGIRQALGARRHDVRRQIVGEGLRVACAGTTVGLGVTLLTARFLDHLLVGVTAGDLRILAAVVGLVLLAAALAADLPARRAARLDPLQALRDE